MLNNYYGHPMKAKMTLPRHGPAALKESFLAVLVVCCMLAGGLIPRFALDGSDYEVLSKIMQSQSTLLQFFTFATIPSKIVSDLLAPSRSMAPAAPKTHKERPAKAANSSADYSLINTDGRGLTGKVDVKRLSVGPGIMPAMFMLDRGYVARAGPTVPIGDFSILLLITLLCLMLPRSNTADAAAAILIKRLSEKARLARASWVFFFPETNNYYVGGRSAS